MLALFPCTAKGLSLPVGIILLSLHFQPPFSICGLFSHVTSTPQVKVHISVAPPPHSVFFILITQIYKTAFHPKLVCIG